MITHTSYIMNSAFILLLFFLLLLSQDVLSSDVDWSQLTADQLSALSVDTIASAKSADIQSIPPASCVGFSKLQINSLNVACFGFTLDCLRNIKDDVYQGFQPKCLGHLTTEAASAISASQMKNIPPSSFSGLTDSVVKGFSDGCAGITADQLGYLKDEHPVNTCSGFTKRCISLIPDHSFVGFLPTCLSHLTEACSGFNRSQILNLDTTHPVYACQGISAECLTKMVGDALGAITSACANQLLDNALSLLSATQISMFSLDGTRGLKKKHLSNINSQACEGLKSEQLKNLNTIYPSYACAGFMPECIANIIPSSVEGFQRECTFQMTVQATSGIRVEQLPYLTTDAVGGFKGEHFVALTRRLSLDFVNTLTYDQVSTVSDAAISYFKSSIRSSELTERFTNSSELPTMHWLQLAYSVEKSIVQVLTEKSITNLKVRTFAGLRGDVMTKLPEEILRQISPAQIYNLLGDAVANITAKQIGHIPPEAFLWKTWEGIMYSFRFISDSSIPSITLDQLTNALTEPSRLDKRCTCSQFEAMTMEQIDLITRKRNDIYQAMRRICIVPSPSPIPTGSVPHHSEANRAQWNSLWVILVILVTLVHHELLW